MISHFPAVPSLPSPDTPSASDPGSQRGRLGWLLLLLGLPLLLVLLWNRIPPRGTLPEPVSNGTSYPASPIPWTPREMESPAAVPSWTTHVQLADRNGDGRRDIIVCDARFNQVVSYDQTADGGWTRSVLATEIPAPAHATLVDLDQDGRLDLVVSSLGNIWPDDLRVGKLIWLRNTGEAYEPVELLTDVRRVADAQPGDFDGDGDIDLAVAVFGYARGEILWLENDGQQAFTSHQLFPAAGAIHGPVADFDGDGDLDIAAVVSQDREQVWGFDNDGKGTFTPRLLFESLNYDLGSAGLVKTDLDGDGDMDLLLPAGDNLEDSHSYPQPYHGCFWLENNAVSAKPTPWTFTSHRISNLGGTYAASAGDLDGDGDKDVVLVSMFNDWDRPGHASLVWLENDGKQTFRPWQVETDQTHLVTVDCADLNGDGRAEVVTGPLHLHPPFRNSPPATLWTTASGKAAP